MSVDSITPGSCPTWSELLRWVEDPDGWVKIAVHVESCPECEGRLALIRTLEEGGSASEA
jgi:hypothetical protein